MRTYILTLCPRLFACERERAWKDILSQNFKKAHSGYINTKAAHTVMQDEYIKVRYEMRIKLQERHYVSSIVFGLVYYLVSKIFFLAECSRGGEATRDPDLAGGVGRVRNQEWIQAGKEEDERDAQNSTLPECRAAEEEEAPTVHGCPEKPCRTPPSRHGREYSSSQRPKGENVVVSPIFLI